MAERMNRIVSERSVRRIETTRPIAERRAAATSAVKVARVEPTFHVKIEGAGMAGIEAYKVLTAKGWRVSIDEAQDRIGGRCLSLSPQVTGYPIVVDQGAAWIHGEKTNHLRVIANELGIKRARTNLMPTTHSLFINGRPATKKQVEQFKKQEDGFLSNMAKAAEKGIDGSAAHFLPQGMFGELIGDEEGQFENGVPIAKADSKDTGNFGTGHDEFVGPGMETLVHEYGKDVAEKANLNTAVNKIAYKDGMVTISSSTTIGGETTKKTETAAKVLVTVSTGVLASGDIKFYPPLPKETRDAIAHKPMGIFNRANLMFDSNIFANAGDKAKGLKHNTWVVCAETGPDGKLTETMAFIVEPRGAKNMAVAFFSGKDWEGKTDAEIFAIAQRKLSKMFGQQGQLVKGNVTRWGQNKYTRGSFSASRPGFSDAAQKLGKPVKNLVYFGGEATAEPRYNGSVEGARREGKRQAEQIHRDLLAEGYTPTGPVAPTPAPKKKTVH